MTSRATTKVDAPALAKGVSYSERTRMVMEARPDLIEAMQKAAEEQYRHEDTWQDEVARHQHDAGMPEQHLESPYRRAAREASTAVFEKSEELLAAKNQEEERA